MPVLLKNALDETVRLLMLLNLDFRINIFLIFSDSSFNILCDEHFCYMYDESFEEKHLYD